MSRNYECQAEVFPVTAEERDAIAAILETWGLEIDCSTESFDHQDHDGWSFWGSIQLTLGEAEDHKHETLRSLLPDRALTTRWRYIDDQPWDDVIQTEPLSSTS